MANAKTRGPKVSTIPTTEIPKMSNKKSSTTSAVSQDSNSNPKKGKTKNSSTSTDSTAQDVTKVNILKVKKQKDQNSSSTTNVVQNKCANLPKGKTQKTQNSPSTTTVSVPKVNGANDNPTKKKPKSVENSPSTSTTMTKSKGNQNNSMKIKTVTDSPKNSASDFIKPKNCAANWLKEKAQSAENSPSTSTNQSKRKSEKSESTDGSNDLVSKFQAISLSPNVKEELPCNVLYYGWFFSEESSISLKELSYIYLRECYCVIPQFRKFLNELCTKEEINDPFEYYKTTVRTKTLKYHVTAKFCGRELILPYQNDVNNNIGKAFRIEMIGFFLTPTSFGIRVKLTKAVEHLFDQDRKESKKKSKCRPSGIPRLSKGDSFPCSFPGIEMIPQLDDLNPPSSRAHVTIGVSPRTKAIQAGLDLLDICDLELRQSSVHTQDYRLPSLGALVRQFGRSGDAFVIYPTHLIAAEGIFKPFI